ncbi:MAG: hypothetical protein H5U02_00280 [Clostridia bacterium]|nr:hypothetical protein [Clostridia bacterium]
MRSRIVSFAGKDINVQEKKIGELEALIRELFPESKGDISRVDLGKLLGEANFDLLYSKLPKIFPELTKEDVKNAYMSELEALVEALVDVNFLGIKRLLKPMLSLAQAGLPQK